ncbi:tyrosine protein phosphatase 1 [Lithohypha guttulata]|nr:tyrosine protein phosphatase 1 [Lithohypha guttulata]
MARASNGKSDGTTMKMPAYLEKSRSEISASFQELEWKQRFRLFHAMENPNTSPYKVDRSDVVVSRNRYGNVQPWDASRIKLKTPICGSDYVNASPIVLKRHVLDSPNITGRPPAYEAKYIATQGPKQGQKSHFWHMVHQEVSGDTGVIIMLTQIVEDSKEKCGQYYPSDLDDPTMSLLHEEKPVGGESSGRLNGEDPFLDSDYIPGTDCEEANSQIDSTTTDSTEPELGSSDTITLLSKEFDSSVRCEVRKLRLLINDEPKTIIHYLFGRWPDFGKPDVEDRRALVELSRRTYDEAGGSARIVHCSAGVGRTGTWIALDFLVREVEDGCLLDNVHSGDRPPKDSGVGATKQETLTGPGPPKLNTPTQEDGFDKDDYDLIFETVNTLREQRMMMVIREVQYSFLYDVVREATLEKYRSTPEGAVVKETESSESQAHRAKQPRIPDEATVDSGSDAETEIIGTDDDPYAAVSPDILRRGLSQEF